MFQSGLYNKGVSNQSLDEEEYEQEYTAPLMSSTTQQHKKSSNDDGISRNTQNIDHANEIALESHSGWRFYIHPAQNSHVDGFSYSCHPFHRGVAWSYSCSARNGINNNNNEWSIQSELMLEVTYRPAYQALPSYTATNSTAARLLAKACCRRSAKPVHFVREVYTWEDILNIEHFELDVKGVGRCSAVKIILRAKPRYHDAPNDVDVVRNPSVTFAVPVPDAGEKLSVDNAEADDECPPLIWKADVPADSSIAIQTITVFDGMLVTKHDEEEHGSDEFGPTHVYCNGWQSWSFAGSIPKGEMRPSSALPRVFSKAFNRGGKLPPPGVLYMKRQAMDRLRLLNGNGSTGFDESSVTYHADDDNIIQVLPKRSPAMYKSEFFACLTQQQKDTLGIECKLDEQGGPALVIGWLSQRRQFGIVSVDDCLHKLAMHCPCDGAIATKNTSTDWAYCQIMHQKYYGDEPMAAYVETVADHCGARQIESPLTAGWCSWYHYYEKISEVTLKANFQKLAELNLKVSSNVAIIDDGYMTHWGDWEDFKPGKFSGNSMKELANAIKSNGMRPGLWIAPFACDKGSKVARDQPHWIIRNHQGAFANSANCGKWFYGLDATNPEVREHAAAIVRKAVHDWGFEVLKLDFLYASCLQGNGKYDMSLTRAEAMHLALQTVREAAGESVFLIGCGCPIGSAVGYINGMRISADTGPSWRPTFPLPWWDWSTLPCLFAMIRNSLTRMSMGHRWWHNDPDCILLGSSTSLTINEVKSAASIIAMSGGMFLLSDDLSELSPERVDIATKIFPITGATAVPLDVHCAIDILPTMLRIHCSDQKDNDNDMNVDNFVTRARVKKRSKKRNCIHMAHGLGSWCALSLSNWDDVERTVHAPFASFFSQDEAFHMNQDSHLGYHVFSFWNSNYIWFPGQPSSASPISTQTVSKKLGPHETEIFHIKAVSESQPQYIGSDLHFSCGFEVDIFDMNRNSLRVKIKTSLQRSGHIYVFIPNYTSQIKASVNTIPFSVDIIARVSLTNEKFGHVLKIPVWVQVDGSDSDGIIYLQFS